jgi:DNA-binding CsgD family transcriptional regulator
VNDVMLKRRARSYVAVLDERFEIVFCEAQGEATCRSLIPHAILLVQRGEESAEIDDGEARYLVRVTPIVAATRARFAMIVEPRGVRRPLVDAAQRFGLTLREVDVLGKIVDGASNREIAAALHIVEGTVQEHVRNLCRKTNARRRGDLLARVFGFDPAAGSGRFPTEQGRDHP